MKTTSLMFAIILFSAGFAFAQPAPTQSTPPALSAASDGKAEKKKAANLKREESAAASRPAITLPPEKANPVAIPKLDKPPVIDGKLDDEVWQHAVTLRDFYQTSPGDNIEPSRKTEVMIAYDAKFLYFAFHAYDEPDKVRATVAKRDNVFGEDNVRVFLDTFNDQRRAYVLGFNPFGIQQDGIYTEGSGTDFNFDIVMESKGVMTADGWTIEVAIPFKSLRYTAGKDKLWGIQIWRNIDRFNDEIDSWMPNNRDKASLLNQAGHITGLEGILTQRQLEIIPSLTISEKGQRLRSVPLGTLAANPALVDPGRFVNQPIGFDPGVTVKLGITPTITLDAAVNPDFAQVEADSTVVLANQRFPIFFPEKRPFFLEGIDYFQTPLNVVHTRTIIDPDLAVKLTGKSGRNTFGLLVASDNGPGNFSEQERLDPFNARAAKFFDQNSLVGVLRLKRDIGRESSIGFLATTYNFIDKYNDVAGFDGRFKLDPKTIFQFQVLGTRSHRFFFDPVQGRSEDRVGNGLGYYWLYDYTGRRFGWFLAGLGRTRDYRADVGFTRRTNTNNNEFFWRYNNEPNPKAKIIQKRIQNYNSINYDFQGRLQNTYSEVQGSINLPRTTYLQVGVSYAYERLFEEEFGPQRQAPPCAFDPTMETRPCGFFGDDSERSTRRKGVWFFGETTFNKQLSGYFFIGRTDDVFDFDFGAGPKFPRVSPAALADPLNPDVLLDPGPGRALDIDTGVTYKPINALNMFLGYTKSSLVRNDTGRVAFDDNIFVFRGTYQFTRFTFARARIDYDSLASNARGQFLLGWTPNPGTAFYVGYNDDVNYNGYNTLNRFTQNFNRTFYEPGVVRNGREFFIKVSYLFRRSF